MARGRGRPKHEPTEKTRGQVSALVSFGVHEEDIATFIDIAPKTLRKWYRRELNTAMIARNLLVGQALFRNAVSNNNVTAQIFWAKTRMGFRETLQVTTPPGEPAAITHLPPPTDEDAERTYRNMLNGNA